MLFALVFQHRAPVSTMDTGAFITSSMKQKGASGKKSNFITF